MTAWLGKPTRSTEQRAIGHGVAELQSFVDPLDQLSDYIESGPRRAFGTADHRPTIACPSHAPQRLSG